MNKVVMTISFKLDEETYQIIPFRFKAFDVVKEVSPETTCDEIVEWAEAYYKTLALEPGFSKSRGSETGIELSMNIVDLYNKSENIMARFEKGERLKVDEYLTKLILDFSINAVIDQTWHGYLKSIFGTKVLGTTKRKLKTLSEDQIWKRGEGQTLKSLIYNEDKSKELNSYLVGKAERGKKDSRFKHLEFK